MNGIEFANGSCIQTIESKHVTRGIPSEKISARIFPLSRHDVYEISKDLFDYNGISKEDIVDALINLKKVYGVLVNGKTKIKITNNIFKSEYIFRLLIPCKDNSRDTYIVLMSSDVGVDGINPIHDYDELMYYKNKYKDNLG